MEFWHRLGDTGGISVEDVGLGFEATAYRWCRG